MNHELLRGCLEHGRSTRHGAKEGAVRFVHCVGGVQHGLGTGASPRDLPHGDTRGQLDLEAVRREL